MGLGKTSGNRHRPSVVGYVLLAPLFQTTALGSGLTPSRHPTAPALGTLSYSWQGWPCETGCIEHEEAMEATSFVPPVYPQDEHRSPPGYPPLQWFVNVMKGKYSTNEITKKLVLCTPLGTCFFLGMKATTLR